MKKKKKKAKQTFQSKRVMLNATQLDTRKDEAAFAVREFLVDCASFQQPNDKKDQKESSLKRELLAEEKVWLKGKGGVEADEVVRLDEVDERSYVQRERKAGLDDLMKEGR